MMTSRLRQGTAAVPLMQVLVQRVMQGTAQRQPASSQGPRRSCDEPLWTYQGC